MAEKQHKQTRLKIGKIISYAVMIVCLVFVAAAFISASAQKPMFLFGRSVVWVQTGSMEGTIPARSFISVKKASGDDVKKGDIIMFYSRDPQIYGKLNTHRVVDIDENGDFVTKGDANAANDGYTVKKSDVVGIYSNNLPVMTFVGRVMYSDAGIFIIIGIFVVCIAVGYVPDIVAAVKENKKKAEEEKQKLIRESIEREVEKLKDDEKNG